MLVYKIFVTNMEQYEFIGEEMVQEWEEKKAELRAEGKNFNTKVEYHQYELKVGQQWTPNDIEEVEVFELYDMEGNVVEFDDDDEWDGELPAEELHTFQTLAEALDHIASEIKDFENQHDEHYWSDGMTLTLVDVDSGEVIASYNKQLVHVMKPEPHFEFINK